MAPKNHSRSVASALAQRGVRVVLGTVVDLAGVTRAKGVPVDRLPAFAEAGMGASPSWLVFCVDAGIAFTPDLGVTGDLRLRIDTEHVTVVDAGTAWAPAEFEEQDGTSFAACPRSRLRQVVTQVRHAGLTALIGAELEFVLVEPDGTARSHGSWQGYGIRAALDVAPFLADVAQTFDAASVPIEQLHAEYGSDQFEISLAPADPLRTADRVVLARILLGRAAARHGVGLSFAPVPFLGGSGNGAHLHLSLADAAGPLFSGGTGPHGMTDAGGAAIAGIVAGLPDVQGVLAGSVLSPLRLKPGNWAGAFACWGLENREAAVRFCAATAGNPHGAHLELKCIDGSANPYVAAAALLGTALHGIDRRLPLPSEVPVDPATLPEAEREHLALASTQTAALDALEHSSLARDILGAPIVEATLAVRRHEHATYADDHDAAAAVCRLAFSC